MKWLLIALFGMLITTPLAQGALVDPSTVGEPTELGDFFYTNDGQIYNGDCCRIYIYAPNGTIVINGDLMDNGVLAPSFNNYTFTPTLVGWYSAVMSCKFGVCAGDPGPHNQSRSFLSTRDSVGPTFSNYSPSDGIKYPYIGKAIYYNFSVTVIDATTNVHTVLLSIGGKGNYTTTKLGDWYYGTLSGLDPGVYTYNFFANDSFGNDAYSNTRTFAIFDPSYQPSGPPPEEPIVRKPSNLTVTPNNITGTFDVLQPQQFILNVKNRAEGENVSFETNLFDVLQFNGKSTYTPLNAYVANGPEYTLTIDFIPITQDVVTGEIRVKNQYGELVKRVPILLQPGIIYPIRDFITDIGSGNVPLTTLYEGITGIFLGIPKILIWLLPLLLIVVLRMVQKKKVRKLTWLIFLILFFVVSLLIPNTIV